MLYLFRKRIQTFRDSFPRDICILSDDFGQRLVALYENYKRSKKTRVQRSEYPVTDELLQYTTGQRPRRGRAWSSNVDTFYVPWNHNNQHWILLVVVVSEWTIWVYDSVPSHWNSIERMKNDLRPFSEYFPFLLQKCKKFKKQHKNFGTPMLIRIPPSESVPQNSRT